MRRFPVWEVPRSGQGGAFAAKPLTGFPGSQQLAALARSHAAYPPITGTWPVIPTFFEKISLSMFTKSKFALCI